MKQKFVFSLLFLPGFVFGQTGTHLQIEGRFLKGTCGDTIVLRGINYAPYNWGYSASENYFDEIGLTGANCVRIVWYKNSGSAIYNNLVNLDSALTRCVRAKMIPILELHDATCTGNITDVTALLPFFTTPAFKALELKFRQHLILNIANEAGVYAWSPQPATALNTYKTTYINAITNLRNNGLQVPIMIDAPDCGTNSDAITNAGTQIFAADALSNTMFSIHGYWYGFAGNNPATMATKVQALQNTGLCVFFGEVANQQDDASPCQYNLAYTQLLGILKTTNIGWAAWGWYHDVCPLRQISNNGQASNLSAYGQVIVNDAAFGLKATAIQPLQFKTNCGKTCTLTTGTISGPTNPCTNIFNGTDTIYKIKKVRFATGYLWSSQNNSPGGAGSIAITGHPGGTGENDTIVTLHFAPGFVTGALKVQAVNNCGVSLERSLTITTKKVTIAGQIAGNTAPCPGAVEQYSCPPAENASSYAWTVPLNAKILSGQGTGQIMVLYPTGSLFKTGYVRVKALSICGNSSSKSLPVTKCIPLITFVSPKQNNTLTGN